jgi:hypothetical protein
MADKEEIQTTGRTARRRTTRHLLWRFVGWMLAFELLLLWVVLFAPVALLWFLTAGVAALAAVTLVTGVLSAWPHGGVNAPEQ